MDIGAAFLLFFSGVGSYMLGIKIFKTWSKLKMYKITYINCLAVLQFADSISQEILKSSDPDNKKDIEGAFDLWREMAVHSLNSTITDREWKEVCVNNWISAMRILEKLEKKVKS